MSVRVWALALLALFVGLGGGCRVKFPNPFYVAEVEDPSFAPAAGPLLLQDLHHSDPEGPYGGHDAFFALAVADGFRYMVADAPYDELSLAHVAVLVVFIPEPDYRPFSQDELGAVCQWVADGGGLMVFGDHGVLSTNANDLAACFGVELAAAHVIGTEGHCSPNVCPETTPFQDYTFGGPGSQGTLADHPITAGLPYVQSYDGGSIRAWPASAVPLLRFGPDSTDRYDETASYDGEARVVGGEHGHGRWLFSSDTQIFTSKCYEDCDLRISGFDGHIGGTPDAEHNETFALRALRWVAGTL